ncbi:hypothetical protein [Candidatus Pelagibacter sp.]|uniref:hypothetical protein n=1 Tax=Candidatus Pelagibacter sp. TaxID=2024849 RepID=UPI003F86C890|tara:strand:+ start:1492 stop:2385 length:894 start_codon:yes stop_codon:yes gene_type:complete
MYKNNEKGFALILSIILLIVMSLMGGSLIVISSGDHQNNNSSDQYQQTFYVAETGLIEGEKWILDNYLGHWHSGTPPTVLEVLGQPPTEAGANAVYQIKKDLYEDTQDGYQDQAEDSFYRLTFGRGPAANDTIVNIDDSQCLKSFRNLDFDENGDIKIAGKGKLPIQKSFLDIVGPLLCDGDYNDCLSSTDGSSFRTSSAKSVINESDEKARKSFVQAEFNFLKRFAYEYFILNIGMAAFRDEGSSIAMGTSNVDTQGTAYKIYSCGIFYGPGGEDELHNGEIEILIALENVVVMPS